MGLATVYMFCYYLFFHYCFIFFSFRSSILLSVTSQISVNTRAENRPALFFEVRDPREKTKVRNLAMPGTIVFPRQFQPALLTYRRLLARRLCKIDEQGVLVSCELAPFLFL
jgi:hypothetical protein